MSSEAINQGDNQPINRLYSVNLFYQVLAFLSDFINFNTLFPSFSQVSVNFLA